MLRGLGQSSKHSTLEGSTATPWLEITWPKKWTVGHANEHLDCLTLRVWAWRIVKNSLRCAIWVAKSRLYTKMSSKNTKTNLRKSGLNAWIIRAWKVDRALERSNGITTNSQWPSWVRKVVLWISYPAHKLILKKTYVPWSSSRSSSTIGIEKWSLIFTALRAR